MKFTKDKKVIISISSIVILLAVSVIGIISRGIQTTTGITTDLENAKDASVIQSNSTLTETSTEWAKAVGGTEDDQLTSVAETSDGGYIAVGTFSSDSIDLGNNIILTHSSVGVSNTDGMIIKYNSSGVAQWAKTIGGTLAVTSEGGPQTADDSITSVIVTRDGGFLIAGLFNSKAIDLGNGVSITNHNTNAMYYTDGMIIKYNSQGVAQWAKAIGANGRPSGEIYISEVSDGGYVIGINQPYGTLDAGDGIGTEDGTYSSMNDVVIIKYNSSGVAQWTKVIRGQSDDYISSIVATKDGGFVVGGKFYSSSIDLGNGIIINKNAEDTKYSDAMIIKYNSVGVAQWAKAIGGTSNDTIDSIIETTDGGIIVGATSYKQSIIDLGNGVISDLSTSDEYEMAKFATIIFKYDSSGVAQWIRRMNNFQFGFIESILETQDKGFLISTYNSGAYVIIQKCNNMGIEQWTKETNQSYGGVITSIVATRDGGFLGVGKEFRAGSVDLGNGIVLNNNSTTTMGEDGIIIKFRDVVAPTVTVKSILNGNTQTSGPYAKSRSMTITVADGGGSGLSSSNSYQYYLSTSESALTGGTWTNYTPGRAFTLGEGKTGLYHLFIKTVSDNIGNISAGPQDVTTIGGIKYHRYVAVFLDNTPPTAGTMTMKLNNSEGTTYTNDTWTNQNVYIEPVNGTDGHSGHKSTTYSVSGPITLENQTNPTMLTEEGTYTITVTTEDNIGLTATRSYTVKIDKTAPKVNIKCTNIDPNVSTYTKLKSVTIDVTDIGCSELSNNNSYQYYLSTSSTELTGGTWTDYIPGEAFTIGEGKSGRYHMFVKTVADNVGNVSQAMPATTDGTVYHTYLGLNFDNTPPTAGTMIMKLNNSEGTTYTNDTWTNQNVYIEPVNGTDGHSGHKSTTYSVSGPITLENQTNPTTLTEEGTYTITVTTTDYTDITSTRTYTVKIDKTAPVLSEIRNSSGGNWATQVTISWDITENESGISKVEVSLSGGKTWESLVQKDWYGYTKSNPRNNTVQIRVTDKAGNISNIESTNLKIETTAPTITVNPTSGEYAKSRNVTITVSDTGGSGVSSNNSYQYYLSTSETELIGGEWTNYTPGEEFTLGEGKTGTFYLFVKRVIDNAGNLSTTGGTATTISNVEYQRFGEYKFDNTAPTCRNSNNETRK